MSEPVRGAIVEATTLATCESKRPHRRKKKFGVHGAECVCASECICSFYYHLYTNDDLLHNTVSNKIFKLLKLFGFSAFTQRVQSTFHRLFSNSNFLNKCLYVGIAIAKLYDETGKSISNAFLLCAIHSIVCIISLVCHSQSIHQIKIPFN